MYCIKCGKQFDADLEFCPECGAPQHEPVYNPAPYPNPMGYTAFPVHKNGYNILSIMGFVLACIAFNSGGTFLGILSIVVCAIGAKDCTMRDEKGKGFAVAGIVIGIIASLFGVIMTFLLMSILPVLIESIGEAFALSM